MHFFLVYKHEVCESSNSFIRRFKLDCQGEAVHLIIFYSLMHNTVRQILELFFLDEVMFKVFVLFIKLILMLQEVSLFFPYLTLFNGLFTLDKSVQAPDNSR